MNTQVDDLVFHPKRHFDRPEDVVRNRKLSHGDKVRILESWKQDAQQLADSTGFSLSFRFRGGLIAGTCFISAGLWCGEERRFLHRVVDLAALKVVDQRPSSTFGLCDLSAAAPELHARRQ